MHECTRARVHFFDNRWTATGLPRPTFMPHLSLNILLSAFAAGALLSPVPAGDAASVTYRVDADASHMHMQTFTEGPLSAFAPDYTFAFTAFTGSLTITPGTLVPASFEMITAADSVRLLGDVSEVERRELESMLREEILESRRYPEMIYRSTTISIVRQGADSYRAQLEGTLTQHGVTRTCPMTVCVAFPGGRRNPTGTVRLRGEFSIRQSDYGMKQKTFALGTVTVKDLVVIAFDLVARRE